MSLKKINGTLAFDPEQITHAELLLKDNNKEVSKDNIIVTIHFPSGKKLSLTDDDAIEVVRYLNLRHGAPNEDRCDTWDKVKNIIPDIGNTNIKKGYAGA